MKKNFKRWLAFLLAVVVIATTCIHSSDAFLWADEEEAPVTEPEETMQTLTVDSSDDAGSGGDEQYSDDEGGFEDEGEYSDEGGSEDGDSEYSGDEGGFEDDSEDYGDGSEDDAADSTEGSDGENADAAEDGSGSGNEGEDVDGENTENSEDTDDSEDEEGFSYVICFYFDGTEDESARISGTDGKSGESILGFATIADKKEHDGKNYVLDRIENKDGVITEDAGSNVVGVYYVAATSDEKTPVQDTEDKKENDDKTEDKMDVLSEKKLSASAGASKVTVSGMLPDGASVNVSSAGRISSVARSAIEKAIEEDNREPGGLKGYDITITDADNEKVTLSGKVRVTIEGTGIEDDYAYVYHVDGDAVQNMSAEKSGDMVSFETDHFSEYWVAGANETEKDGELTTLEDDILVEEEGSVITGCAVSAERINIKVGETTQAQWYTTPENIENSKGVTWTSLKTDVATVDADGVITGVGAGTVNIVGTSNDDSAFSAHIAITVREVGVGSVKITSKINEYYEAGKEIQLACDVKDEDGKATDKHPIIWSSSDEGVATVDRDGNVTTQGQGKVKIRAQVLDVYDEVEIQVYDETPKTLDIQVWVTNQRRGTVSINVPSDGTPVSLQDVIPSICNLDGKDYSFTGKASYKLPSKPGKPEDEFGWDDVQGLDDVGEVRYGENRFEYKVAGGSDWQTAKSLYAFYSHLKGINDETGIVVNVGDWPYNDIPADANKTIRIEIFDGNRQIYGETMFYDNRSARPLGHITFGCDTAIYKVKEAVVSKFGANDWEHIKTYTEEQLNNSLAGISVEFTNSRDGEDFKVVAYVVPKEFTVTYDTNGGEGEAPTQEPKTAVGNEANDDNSFKIASGKGLRKPGYTFAGWAYGGKTYYEGETFKMPAHNVTFEAVWRPVRQIIRYKSENPIKGNVSSTEELFDVESGDGKIEGSTAVPADGYRFVEWKDENGKTVGTSEKYTPEPNDDGIYESHTYTAYFEENEYEVSVSVINGTIEGVTGGEQQEEGKYKVSAGSTFTVNYAPLGGYKLSEIKVDGEAVSIEVFADSYSIQAIDANHTIEVVYVRDGGLIKATGEECFYDTGRHMVTEEGVLDGETVQYYYGGEWRNKEQMSKLWPKNVTVSEEAENGLAIPVRVLDKNDKEIWKTEEGSHPYIKIKPYPVEINITSTAQQWKSDGKYEFEDAAISYEGMSDDLKRDLGSLNLDLTVKRVSDENKPKKYEKDLTLANEEQFNTEQCSNYSFTVRTGDFTITRIQNALKVSLTGCNKIYDGKWYSTTPQVTVNGVVISEDEYSITYFRKNDDGTYAQISAVEAGRKDAGTSWFNCTVSMEGYEDASSEDAAVTISPKEITIRVKPAEKEWRKEDPTLTGEDGYEILTGLVDGDTLTESPFTVSRKGTSEDVGKYEKDLTIRYENSDINSNYTVKVEEGDFEIKGRVTYDGNGSIGNNVPVDNTLYSFSSAVPVQSKGELERDNAVFLGWSTDKTGIIETQEDESKANIIKENDTTSMGRESFTLYAVWAVDEDDDDIPDYRQYIYSLTYDLNGGNGTAPKDDKKYKETNTVTLVEGNPNTLTRDNAVFIGWSENKEAVKDVFSDKPGEGIIQTSVTFGKENITVYAVWAEDAKGPEGIPDGVPDYEEYSITYNSGRFPGLSVLGVTTDNVRYEADEEVILTPYIAAIPDGLQENELVLFAAAWKNNADEQIYSSGENGFTYKMPAANVTFEAQWKYLTVNKEIAGTFPEGGYKVDDVVPFNITVENKGDIAAEGIVVKELLSGAELTDSSSDETTLASLPVGQKVTLEAEYTVTDADLRAGELKNTVSITDGSATATAGCDIERREAVGSLKVTKTIESPKESYAVGDKIEFKVTVENNGAVTVKDIELTESFDDAVIEQGNTLVRFFSKVRSAITGNGWQAAPIEKFTLRTGASKTFIVTYEVQEEDLGHSGFYNVATATGHIDGSDDPVTGTGKSEEITIDDPNSGYELSKEVVAPDGDVLVDGKYPVGSSVEYRIKVKNTGNTTLSNLRIEDTMQALDGTAVSGSIRQADVEPGRDFPENSSVTWDGSAFTITVIPRGATAEFTYKYDIPEGDAGKKIQNFAVIDNGEQVSPEEPIEVVKEALTVTKTASEPENGERYQLGETIEFKVDVENTGNVTLSNITVIDEKVKRGHGSVEFIPDDKHAEAKIASLAPGNSETLYYHYTVVEDDLENILENVATATVNEKDFLSNTVVMKQVEVKTQQAELEKRIMNSGSGENGRFAVDDVIQYEIRVTNTGTQTLEYVQVTDTMDGSTGEIENVKINGQAAQFTENGGNYVFTIPSISPKGLFGQEGSNVATITYDYKVQKGDEGAVISNTAILPSGISKGEKNPDPVTIEKKALEVTKKIIQVRPNGNTNYVEYDGKSFTTGDVVRFEIVVKNTGNVSLSGIRITDSMSGEADADGKGPQAVLVSGNETIDSLEAGDEATLVYDYTVRPEDIAGESVLSNKAAAEIPDTDVGDSESVDIPLVEKISGYSVEKKFESSPSEGMYRKDDLIKYSIEIRNTGNTVYPAGLEIKDSMSYKGEEGTPKGEIVVTSGNASWENGKFVLNSPLPWGGDPVRILYTYKVDASDEGKVLQNTAYDSTGNPNTVETTIEQKKLTVTKEVTSTPANGEAYAVDEYISFKVTLKNDGNVPLDDITVTDRLWQKVGNSSGNLDGDEGQNPFASGEPIALGVGEVREFNYTYQAKETDLGKEIYNVVTASGEGYFDTEETTPVKVEDPDPKVSLTKSVLTPPDGDNGRYKTGTKITYEIRVKNTGNTTLNNVTVKDTMTGAAGRVAGTSVTGARMTASFNEGKWEYTFEINGEIARGEEKVITYDYVIQKEDAGKKIGNTVAVDGDEITTDPDSDDSEEIVVENRKLTVTKTIREPERVYKLGEEIFFDVTVANEGDVTLNGINLIDEMLGGAVGEAELVSGNASDIVLNPGETEKLVYKYEVQPGDIANNALKNKLTATAKDNTKGEDETDYIKIEGQNPAFSILKSIIGTGSGEDGKYAIGDTINYEITITNDGNVALPSMTVADRMENASGDIIADSVKAVIDSGEGGETSVAATWNKAAGKFELGASIPIGGKAVITYGYEVVEADAGKTIINVAGKPTDPGSKETQTEIEDRRIIIDKLVTSTPANPARGYVAGERITFDVRVANPGNVTLSGISIADEMQNAIGAAILVDGNGNALNDNSDKNISLEAGENLVLHYSYEVTRDDIVAGGKEIANKATAEPESGELRGTTEDTSRPVQVDRLHTLTVYYQYADGSTAVETLVQEFAYGDSFAFTIPAITGYTSTLEGNPVQQAVMFDSTLFDDEDPVFTIIYSAIPVTEPGTEPETEPTATPVPGGGEPEPEPDTPDTPVPPVPPVPPVDDVPVPEAVIVPVAPAAVAAAPGILGGGAGLVAIGDEPVPLDGVITQDDDGNVVIVPVDEVEIPLADRELDDHKCCILSFLLMLATLIIYSWFTHSMKKRQKKLAELKDQLAEETLKRQLGITDNENSAR